MVESDDAQDNSWLVDQCYNHGQPNPESQAYMGYRVSGKICISNAPLFNIDLSRKNQCHAKILLLPTTTR